MAHLRDLEEPPPRYEQVYNPDQEQFARRNRLARMVENIGYEQTLNDLDEFKEQTQLSETLFSDTLKIETSVGTITRNMLIGRT